LAWLLLGLAAAGSAAASTCAPATTQGDAPSDFQDYCWLDFTGYNDTLAQGAGQPFTYSLPDGSTLSFTLNVTTNKASPAITPTASPSWSGSAIGHTGFIGIPGLPVLYEAQTGSTVTATLSNIVVTPPPGSGATVTYDLVGADGESTNGGESLSFTTNGAAWVQLAQIANGTVYPTVSGLGTATVTETGAAGTVGAYAFGSLNNPTQVSTTMVGNGLQGSMFAIRYASLALNVQYATARAFTTDQFSYSIKNSSGTALAAGTTTGASLGPFTAAVVDTDAAGFPFVVSEVMAAGSTGTLANYAESLTCTNLTTGSSSTTLPSNQAVTTYSFPALHFGDAVSCLFTNTANRADVVITKSGPATVAAGATLSYTLLVANSGPLAANGFLVQDAVVANFTQTAVTCTAATGGAACPAAGNVTVANLTGAGIAIPTLPNGGSVTFSVSGTAGTANITNVGSVTPPAGLVNSNATPTSSVTTTVTASADLLSTVTFPATVNAGQPVSGTVTYTNNGPSTASGTTFALTLSANLPAAPTLTGLPAGATFSYNSSTGVVTFTGMPTTLTSGSSVGPITVSYTQPPTGTSSVTATDSATTADPNSANNTATATIGGVAEADLASAVSFPASVNAGQPVSGTVTYTNNGPSSASGVTFGLTLASNLSAAPVLSGLPAGATYAYTASTGVVTFTGMPTTLASGATVGPVTVSYTQPASGTSTVTATSGATTADPNPANNTATATISGVAEADLASSVSFPASVNAGQTVSGTVTYTNNGPSSASGVAFGLTLASGLSAAPTLTGLPAGATYSYNSGTGVVTLTGMPTTLASGATVGPVTVSYTQPPTGTSTVTATISATTADPNSANNTATATITGVTVADLASAVSFPASVNAGQPVSGTVTYTNNGPSTASSVSFALTLSANLSAAPTLTGLPAGATYSYSSATGVVTLTGMPTTLASASSIGPITVSYTQPGSATSTVTATDSSSTLDSNPANNTATATITGVAEADLASAVSFPASVNAGQAVSGTVTYTNNGPSSASGVTFGLTLSANLSAPTVTGLPAGATYSYNSSTGVVTLSGMPTTLASASSIGPITVSYTQPGSATSTVTATIAATTADPNPANNTASATIAGVAEADLASAVTFPASVNAGQPVSGTVLFSNSGPSSATGVTFALTLSANLSAPTLSGLPAGATYSYNSSTGVVTLTGMPTTLASGSSVGPVTVSYTQPSSGTSTVTATIGATTADPNPANNTATATISGVAVADLASAVSFPASVNAGQTVSGTVTYTNNGPSTASSVSFALTLSANLSAAPTLTGLPAGATYSYNTSTGVISFTGMPATLASGASVGPITVSYTQLPAGTSTVTATDSSSTLDSNPANNTATATITGVAEADLASAVSFPASVNAGQPVSGTVTYTNNGPSTASGVTFALTLSSGLSAAPTLTGLPAGATYSYNSSTGVVTLTGMPATLASGATVGPVTVSYTQPASATSTVTATIGATTADPNPANNTATATITGVAEADLASAVTFPASVNAGQPVSGTVKYTNNGPSSASGVTFALSLSANLPAAPTLSGLPAGATYSYNSSTGVVTLTGMPATLASGASVGPVTVSYTQPASGTSTVTATVSATTADPNSANNLGVATISGVAEADLASAVSFPASVNAGQAVSGTVTYTNNGPSTASGVTFGLTLSSGLTAAPTLTGLPAGATYSYNSSTGVVTLTGMPATLASGAVVGPITVSYTQPPTGTSSVTATIGATTADPNSANNTTTATITGVAEADLASAVSFPASVNAGQPVSGTVTYTNNGPSTASGVTFALSLSSGLSVAPTLTGLPAGATYSYNSSTGVVTLTGMPATLTSGAGVGPITVSYTQPPTGTSTVTATIGATTADPNSANNLGVATISGVAEADLASAVSFPASVNAGQPVSGTVTYTNNGPSTASGVSFGLTLSANLSAAPTLTGLPAGATYSYNTSTGVVTLTGMPATLASGASVGPVTVSYTQPPTGTSTVTATISATTADPNSANNSATATITGVAEADLASAVSFPASVNAGQPVSGTVTYTNNGPSTASGVGFGLTLSANLSAAPTLTGLPAGATYSYNSSTGVVTLTGMPATLASGASVGPVTVSYTQPPTGTSTVTATISATTADPTPGNNTATATITGVAEADLASAVSFPASVNAGQSVSGTVTYTNNGPSSASGVSFGLTLSANLPAAPTLSGLPAGATFSYNSSTGVVTFTGMPTTLASGAVVGPITVSYTQPPTGTSSVTATIGATTADPNSANNLGVATITGVAEADLASAVSFPASVNAGQPVSGTVTYTNNGPSTANGVTFGLTLSANLPAAPTLTGLPAGATFSYNSSTGVVTLTGMPATLASSATVGPITVSYTQPPAGTSTVTATISATTADPNSANNTATASITGVAVADLASAVSFPASVNAGQPVSGTVTYTNNGPSTASGVSFGLTLSASLPATPTLSGLPAGATFSYNSSTGVVTLTGMPATLASSATVGPITVSYTQPPAGTSTVTATDSSSTLDSNPANNTATATISGSAQADLASAVSFPASVNAGQAVSGSVTYTNNGPSTASGVSFGLTLSANLPATPTLSGLPAGATYSYNSSTGVVTFSGMPATLASSASVGPITVSYTQPPAGTSTVTATTSAATADPNPANNTATATIAGVAVADLASAVTFPATVNAGQPVSGTVLYTNNGPSSASGATFSLTLSANLPAAPTLSGLPAGATYSYNSSTGVVTLTGMPATLASGASVGPITVSYTQPPAGTSTVTATDSSSTLDSNPANNTASATIGGAAVADLASAVTFPATVNAGQPVSGTVTYTNNGPSSASAVAFGLTLSANLSAAPTLSGLPAGATYSYNSSTGVVTLTGMPATLASGASVGPITVSYTQPPAGTSTVTATDSSSTLDPNAANNTASATIGGAAVADLATAVTFPATVNAGQTVSGTVTYTNNGPSSASAVSFGLTLSSNLSAAPTLSGLPAGATYSYNSSTGVVTLTGMPATLASGASVGPITVSYTQPPAGTSTVTATDSSSTLDPNAANNTASATIGGVAEADVASRVTFPTNINAGQPVSGTVTYSNNGPSTANAVTFALTLSANLSPAPVLTGLPAGATYSYNSSTGVVTFTGMPTTLASGSSVGPITVSYTQPTSGTSSVTATINSTTDDPNPANNTATTIISGSAVADLVSTVTFPASVNAGQAVSGTVLYTNNGPSSASAVSFGLTLSANLSPTPTLSGLPAGATYSYNSSTGVVTFTGMPATLASGSNVGPITVSYTQPASANSTVTATVNSTTLDPNPANNTATATIAGSAVADLASAVTFPASVNAGQPVSGTVTYTNNGPSTASAVTFGLTLSANLSAAPTLTGLPAGATFSYNSSTGVVTLTGMPATLASGSSVGPITVNYTQASSGSSTVTATVSATTLDPNPANNTATAAIGGSAVADLASSVTFPGSVNAGQPVSGTVTYTNNGPSSASGVTLGLTLSPNLSPAPTLSGLPAGATYSYNSSTGIVSFTGMPTTLASGASVGPITVSYTQPAAGTSTVTATDSATTSDPNPANNTATATIAGVAVADLASTVTFPASVNAGQPVSGTVTYTNNGPSSASAVSFGLTVTANLTAAPTLTGLPAGATYSYNTGTGVVTLTGMPATLASASSVGPITVSYTQPPAGTSTVTASVNSTTLDPNPANNTATATIAGVAVADLASAVTFPATVNAGQPVSGTVVYTNSGPSTASGVAFGLTLSANLPAAPTLSGLPAGATFSYNTSTGVVSFTGMPATLASGATVGPITVSYTQAPTGTSTVTATVSATTLDPNPANNTATATIAGVAVADLASAVTFPATVNAGQPVSGTVTYTNNGPSSASAVSFGLTLSANLPAAPTLSGLPAGATYSYAASTGIVTLSGMPATLASGGIVGPITVSYTQPPTGTSTVTATVSATTSDPNPANNTATASIGGVPAADLASTATFPATVNAGQPVSGTVLYTNNGPSSASAVTFALTLSANLPAAPTLTGLPAGATYSYNTGTGVVTLTGMPAALTSGQSIGPITVSYTQPPTGTSSVTASDNSTTLDPNPANNTATASIAGVAVADLASKVTFPATVNAGQPVSGTVLYTNNGPSTASGVTFGLTLSANLPATPTLTGLPAGATYSYAASTGIVTLTGMPATLASAGSVGPITVNYTQAASGTSTVTATISAATSDPNPANNTATATVSGVAVADLASAVAFPASVNAGQPVSGTVTYTNNGPSSASGVSFALTLSPNLPVAPVLSGLPAGATYSYAASTGIVTLTGMPATLASGGIVGPITVSYTQPPTGTSTVTATVSATTSDPNPANNTVTATVGGVPAADLASTVTFPASINAGQPVSGTVQYTNNGPSTASGVTFGLTLSPSLPAAPTLTGLPAGATYSYNTSSGVVTLTGMPTTLTSGSSVGPITVSYTQPPAGSSSVTATVSATTLDPNPANNTATATVAGVAVADLASAVTFPASVNAGQPVSGTVRYTNNGPSSASGVTFGLTLSANLPAAPTLSGLPAGATYSYNSGSGVVTFTGMAATLASGVTVVGPITVSYTQAASGTSTVTATVSATTLDPNPANNTATATIAGAAVADLASAVAFPASVNAGQPVSGTVTYTNNGPSSASGVSFALTLSPNLPVAPVLSGLPAGATYSYAASTGVVTLSGMPATLGSGASIGPITVNYTQPASGSSTVTTTVSATTLDPNSANNTAAATIGGVPAADLASTATFPANVNAGQPVSGTVSYTNNGPSSASGVTFGLTLSANLPAAPTLTGLPAGAAYSYNSGSGVVTLAGMPTTLASGASVGPITVSYTQPAAGTSTVTASVNSTTLDPNPANNTVTATIAGVAVADLASAVTFPASVNAGQTVSGTVRYTNSGPSTASGVAFGLTLSANLPAAPTLSGLPAGATYSYNSTTGVVSFTGMPATLASAGSIGPITVSYTQPPAGTSTVTATVSATTLDPNPANNTSTATIAGVAVADLASAVAFPASVNAGQPVSGTVTYTNHGPSSASGVAFALTLSANLPAAPTLSGLPIGATYSYTASTGVVSFTGMPTTLALGQSVGPITVGYTQPASGTSTVTATVSATTLDPTPANNTASASITGVTVADLASAVAFPASVNAGQPVSGTLTYTNNGPSAAGTVSFGLTLSANLPAAPVLSGLPAGATYSYNASSGVVTFTGMPATLASGAVVGPITVSYTQTPAGTSTVTATVHASTLDSNPANNTATASVTGVPVADLASRVTFPASENAGQAVSGTVLFANDGPSSATGVSFMLTLSPNLPAAPTLSGLPAGVTYGYNSSSGVVTLTGMPATLASGSKVGPITLSYTQPASGSSTVTAAIASATLDPDPSNNTASAIIAGVAAADLASKVTFPASVDAGQAVSGTVLYTNNGPSTAGTVSFDLTLSPNLSAAPTLSGLPAGASYGYTPSSGVVTLTGMPVTLASGTSIGPITVSYIQPASGASSVTATVTSTTLDPNPANNTATASIAVVAVADLASAVAFPASVNAGQPVSGTVLYTNNGPSSASGVAYGLKLPANLAAAPTISGLPAGASHSYNSSTGVVTFTAMPATLAFGSNVGPITVGYTQPPSGTSTVTATVSSSTLDPNPANNTASAAITGVAMADLASKVNFPTMVYAGQPVSGTVLYTNNGPSSASGVTFALALSPNLAAAPTLSGLPAGAAYSYNSSSGVVTLTGMSATLAAGSTLGPITVTYLQPATGTSNVTASVNSSTPDPNPANNTVSVIVDGTMVADLASKLTFPANIEVGQAVSGTVLYTNSGPSPATGATFGLTLTPNLATPPTLTGLPAGATYSYNPSSGVVTLTGLPTTLAAGASGSVGPFTVSYTQPTANSSVTASVHSATFDPNTVNNLSTVTVAAISVANVSTSVSFPAHENAGQTVSGTVLYTNSGPSTATGVTFSLTLTPDLPAPPTLTGLPGGATYSYNASTGVVTLSGMPTSLGSGNKVGPITVSYTQPPSGSSVVTAAVNSATLDPDPANRSATARITGAASSLTGTVFIDNNQDRTLDSGDTPVADVTVQLFSGSRLVASVVTGPAGTYEFPQQPSGAYTVAVTPAHGYASDTPTPVAVTLGGALQVLNFGWIPAGANGFLSLTKTTPLVNVAAGQSVPYTITATNPQNAPILDVSVVDTIPAGFVFRKGSGYVNGKKLDPTVNGRELTWTKQNFAPGQKIVFSLVLTIGAGVTEGEFVNQANAFNVFTHALISNVATATVRIVGDPSFDCPDIIGKVFDDANANGYEDPGEKGIAGVRLVTAQGLLVTTDKDGRYHIACPVRPDSAMGTDFIVKVDERTLPSGYRLTTDNPETVRLTAGKVTKLNFGATIHRVVRVEVNAAAFDILEVRPEVAAKLDPLVASLKDQRSIVRLAYSAAEESDSTVQARLDSLKALLAQLWKTHECRYPLLTEDDIVRSAKPHDPAPGSTP
jgi:uncharacterized repeat protein (TIGR01451 family)